MTGRSRNVRGPACRRGFGDGAWPGIDDEAVGLIRLETPAALSRVLEQLFDELPGIVPSFAGRSTDGDEMSQLDRVGNQRVETELNRGTFIGKLLARTLSPATVGSLNFVKMANGQTNSATTAIDPAPAHFQRC